ncbi:MAG: hypothetical protein ACRD20_09840 [Terriglobales bacterium]
MSRAKHAARAEFGLEGPACYRVCELVIESTASLPELTRSNGKIPDCSFRVLPAGDGFAGEIHWFHDRTSRGDESWLRLGDRGGDYLLRFRDESEFLISRDGGEVQCRPLPGTSESTVRHLFLDQVVPLMLSRRESLVLHASAILTPQGVIAFVGRSGRGKSTLAAAFAQAGFPLVSDDYLVLRKRAGAAAGNWVAVPSYPGVRLWADASDGLFSVLPESSEIAAYTSKRRVSDPALIPFAEAPSALRALYFLGDAEASHPEPAVQRLSPREAFMKLVSCAFNLDIRDRVLLERQFEAIGQVSRELPCIQLDYARDFGMLPAVQRLVADQNHEE